MAGKNDSGATKDSAPFPEAKTLADDEHPDFVAGRISEDGSGGDADTSQFDEFDEFTPVPGGPIPGPQPLFPRIPIPRPIPVPRPIPLPQFCGAVSGRYRYMAPHRLAAPQPAFPTRAPMPGPVPVPGRRIPVPLPGPIIPWNSQTITVRVDVDRFFPQQRISIEVTRRFPQRTAHAIAEVTSDQCHSLNRRTVRGNIVYRDGSAALIPGTTVTFRARRTNGLNYGSYELELSGGGITPRRYDLQFVSDKFDDVDFEVDRVSNAGSIVTSYATHDHPNRPGGMPSETLTLATVFDRAGFEVNMSPNTTTIPTSGAGANGTWSNTEMHNAMITYWSRFSNNPNWAMWVLYAARHDNGRSLGGIMFDSIGPNHRQGTAIFTDSFIQDAPAGDPDAAGWRRRMEFWTAVHEMGHGFNLAHSWQKALGAPQAPGDPWIPLANDPESRSFMNYPYGVSGGQSAFFSDFRFRFSDEELVFMRHAPRRFVQMGNSNWFVNHGFEAPDAMMESGTWSLEIRPNRTVNSYQFLEPVIAELKLTNTSDTAQMVEDDMLADGRHFSLFIQREGALTKRWSPMVTECHQEHAEALQPGKSIYGAHTISTTGDGWIIDEPGFYKVQAAVTMGEEIVVSNVMRIYVAPPKSDDEAALAPDYFTEDVARAVTFHGAPALEQAEDVLQEVSERVPDNPAAKHAEMALSNPKLTQFKVLDGSGGREDLKVKSIAPKLDEAVEGQKKALLAEPEEAANTFGHIQFFDQLRKVAEVLEEGGDKKEAVDIMKTSISLMKDRDVLKSVIDNAEARLDRRT